MMGLVAVCALLLAPLREGGMHLRQAASMEIGRSDSLVRWFVCRDARSSSFCFSLSYFTLVVAGLCLYARLRFVSALYSRSFVPSRRHCRSLCTCGELVRLPDICLQLSRQNFSCNRATSQANYFVDTLQDGPVGIPQPVGGLERCRIGYSYH